MCIECVELCYVRALFHAVMCVWCQELCHVYAVLKAVPCLRLRHVHALFEVDHVLVQAVDAVLEAGTLAFLC